LLFLRRKIFLGVVHKSVQNGASPYKQFCGKIREQQKQQN